MCTRSTDPPTNSRKPRLEPWTADRTWQKDEAIERGEMLSLQQLVAQVRASQVGLQSKLVSHPMGGGYLFLVLGAELGRLAKARAC